MNKPTEQAQVMTATPLPIVIEELPLEEKLKRAEQDKEQLLRQIASYQLYCKAKDKESEAAKRVSGSMRRGLRLGYELADICRKELTRFVEESPWRHVEACPSLRDPAVLCHIDCPDRELRMSHKVMLAACEMYLEQPEAKRFFTNPEPYPYSPPAREYFDDVVRELEVYREKFGDIGFVPLIKPGLDQKPEDL